MLLPAVVLTPAGEVNVHVQPGYTSNTAATFSLEPLMLTCTAHGALWSTSGFGEGLDDQTRVPAYSLAEGSLRVTTTDASNLTNSSRITLSNFTCADHGAMVTCEGDPPTDQQNVTISVGRFESIGCVFLRAAITDLKRSNK